MTAYEIIAKKRDGKVLSQHEIEYFISAYLNDEIADYQVAALLMAVYFRGMDEEEIAALTRAYIQSGTQIGLSALPGKKVDKHSTGGVGDKVSIVLAPLVASLGVTVPMISGRGLGHSGGTLDKLESIPGFKTDIAIEKFHQLLKEHGLGLIGQTKHLVPADKQIYALRDVTATVDCIPLITASIMSKKIAEGIDALVLDVKYGNGAFMKNADQAESLAQQLIKIGKQFDKQVIAILSSMEQPLGYYIGNWLEVRECLHCFAGNGPSDLMEVIHRLSAHMLMLGEVAKNLEEAREKSREAIENGKAFEKFLQIAQAQGGDISFLKTPEKYPGAREKSVLKAPHGGYISEMNTYQIGMACGQLGAGRLRTGDSVDPQAGIILFKKIGDSVEEGEQLLEIHTNRPEAVEAVLKRLSDSITIQSEPVKIPPLILKEVSS